MYYIMLYYITLHYITGASGSRAASDPSRPKPRTCNIPYYTITIYTNTTTKNTYIILITISTTYYIPYYTITIYAINTIIQSPYYNILLLMIVMLSFILIQLLIIHVCTYVCVYIYIYIYIHI